MGGYYSGRWHWYTRKTTVEECHKLKVSHYDKATLESRFEAGEPVYYGESGPSRLSALIARNVVDNLISSSGKTPKDAPLRDPQHGQTFRITRTPCNYGGWRYWLLCPGCGRRCGTLYKPRQGGLYACRFCNDLSYMTAQEAHKYDRLKGWGSYARKLDVLARAELVQRKMDKARFGSKHFRRLLWRYMDLMQKL